MDIKQWKRVRHKVLVEGQSKRSVMREESLHWETLQKMLEHSAPPGYRRTAPKKPTKLDPHIPWIEELLRADEEVHRKQRHTIKRIYERLKEEKAYDGSYTMVRECVNDLKKRTQEVFVPLEHRPGEAQVDFGHALLNVNGQLGKYPFFVMSFPYSDAFYVQVFARECTESFQEGHNRAFKWLGRVPWRISYDNSRIAVSKIMGGRDRKLTDGFERLQSHYLFTEHFCRVRRGNEKGVVEGMVKYARSNFLVPVPQVDSLEELNWELEDSCSRDLFRRVRGKAKQKHELLEEEKEKMRDLPEVPFDACRMVSTTSSSLSLVRFDSNDYSIPVPYAHRPVVVKGYHDEVQIYYQQNQIGCHKRIWDKERVSFEPRDYLALIERKPGALDYALPLTEWNLPDCFLDLRRRLEALYGDEGTRDYIKVLRLLESHSIDKVSNAILSAMNQMVYRSEAIQQYLYPVEDYGGTVFALDGHPHLRHVQVHNPDIAQYDELVSGEPF